MKAITIWQPWASLIANEAKIYETRSFVTKYRGRIAIHAAKHPPLDITRLTLCWPDALKHLKKLGIAPESMHCLPCGAVIATAELVNVWRIVYHPGCNVDTAKNIPIGAESLTTDKHAPDFGDYIVPTAQEIAFGDWTPGRYAWELRNVTPLPVPIPARGQQGLWNWEPEQE